MHQNRKQMKSAAQQKYYIAFVSKEKVEGILKLVETVINRRKEVRKC